ncbi:DNAJ heat shock N-terminal domain-containing protein [Tasmannia lanceolata]|uniref:DNAJ heat shock N-terminal domain-containing protein n=1 Tax=Tasmannia lanceolata TaxID=3420 RepID=UPI0040636D88
MKSDIESALRFKSLAEEKFHQTSIKSALKYAKKAQLLNPDLDDISNMVMAFKIIRIASKSSPNWYKILQLEPFSHINTIKKQYKKLALTLHPDKHSCLGSEEAFKSVGEAFRFLSDKIRKKEYDMKLRINLQSQEVRVLERKSVVETFWTVCSKCRLLHQFERRYVGQQLMCPGCKESFAAEEYMGYVSDDDDNQIVNVKNDDVRVGVSVRSRDRARAMVSTEKKRDFSIEKSTVIGNRKGRIRASDFSENSDSKRAKRRSSSRHEKTLGETLSDDDNQIVNGEDDDVRVRVRDRARAMVSTEKKRDLSIEKSTVTGNRKGGIRASDFSENSDPKRAKRTSSSRHEKTLGEMLSEAKRKSERVKEKMKVKGSMEKGKEQKEVVEKALVSQSTDLAVIAVEDSDFHDFDKDRMEKSFKKAQVWAVYDDDDGMPRHYGLIDEVFSVNPFKVKMSWLDLQSNGDDALVCWEKLGFHISCGRFKVARKVDIDYVNFFSHIVECERAARELYRIYPKKGSVWALYREGSLDGNIENSFRRQRRFYDIVVFLTSYSEMHGLSMAYLEKVEGFKTVFKRREIGCHAINWLEKDNIRLFSHQIPARKLLGEEASDLPKECWELDPASLPMDLLRIGG